MSVTVCDGSLSEFLSWSGMSRVQSDCYVCDGSLLMCLSRLWGGGNGWWVQISAPILQHYFKLDRISQKARSLMIVLTSVYAVRIHQRFIDLVYRSGIGAVLLTTLIQIYRSTQPPYHVPVSHK